MWAERLLFLRTIKINAVGDSPWSSPVHTPRPAVIVASRSSKTIPCCCNAARKSSSVSSADADAVNDGVTIATDAAAHTSQVVRRCKALFTACSAPGRRVWPRTHRGSRRCVPLSMCLPVSSRLRRAACGRRKVIPVARWPGSRVPAPTWGGRILTPGPRQESAAGTTNHWCAQSFSAISAMSGFALARPFAAR